MPPKPFKVMRGYLIGLLALSLIFSSCDRHGCTDENATNYNPKAKKDDGSCFYDADPESFDRGPMLNNLAYNVIVPAYHDLDSTVNTMKFDIQTFVNTPNQTNLDNARNSWQNALIAWQYAGYFEFGPADANFLRAQVNVYPVDTSQVNGNISIGSYNLSSASNYDAKGFQAIDYLLYGIESNDNDIVSAYQNNSSIGVYLNDITNDLSQLISTVYQTWNPNSGNYASSFASNTALDIGGSCNMIFNAFVMHFEAYVRSGKLGIPAGALSFSQTPLPDRVECYYHNELSKVMLDHAFNGLSNIYNGTHKNNTDGIGFKEYLDYLQTQGPSGLLSNDINTQINLAQNEAAIKLNEPLSDFVMNNQATAMEVWDEMQYLVVLLKNDLKSAIGLSITYADADGD